MLLGMDERGGGDIWDRGGSVFDLRKVQQSQDCSKQLDWEAMFLS